MASTNAEMQYRYGRMDMGDLILECERLREALGELLAAKYNCDALAGGNEYMSACSNARRVLNG